MSIHVALHHRTHYRYDRPVAHTPHIVRLRPAPHCLTPILSYSLKIKPEEKFLNWQQDPFGNYLARLVFPEKARELLVEVDLVADMSVRNPFDFFLEDSAKHFPFTYDKDVKKELRPFLQVGRAGPLMREYLATINRGKKPLLDFIVELNQRLWKEISYLIRMKPGVQTPEQTLKKRSGSCRDSAWLLVNIMRRLGIAARFASGYLIQLKPDVKSLDGPSGTEVDFTDLHAWCEVYLPGGGWIGLDPTSGLLAGEGHIPVACAPSPTNASPIAGAIEKCKVKFEHEMSVQRIFESPRVTKPYTEEQWHEIEALGHQVDDDLVEHDVRLTMGGEPTFISIDNMDGEEWNYTALGPEKRRLSEQLLWRLKDKFSSGALIHMGQGKWYPGESLPRWAMGCYWRKDGEPIWHDESLFARDSHNFGHNDKTAKAFVEKLSSTLDVTSKYAIPAYEDAWYYMWKERRLPANVDPLKSNLANKEDRKRLAKVFEQGLDKVIGYVLPLKRDLYAPDQWLTGPWFVQDENLYLVPGDSPIGYRLPLDSLPWVHKSDYPYLFQPDPLAPQQPLPASEEIRRRLMLETGRPWAVGMNDATRMPDRMQRRPGEGEEERRREEEKRREERERRLKELERKPQPGESAGWLVRTAVCVEPRQGKLHVFMPPLESSEDYLTLIAAIEETAKNLGTPVVIEGETPPYDHRLKVLKITPDPGVIEVNIPPMLNWEEMVHTTNTIYDEARLSRLGTEKFMIDGRHVGTGGGNHIVVGGETPADSPFLRRPDLLRSFVNFWQNHPSLSFLFSGLFIGPTSQHPRIDEARNDSLHEMEIAFQQVPDHAQVPPWMVDRLFRNLLVDITGNTHRTEFCIDKLYSPDSSTGRLGLLEMRAFEMPPHARMSLTQQLLLRSLIARFWKTPYQKPLVRWDTEMHDRFMLPHYNLQDFRDVIEDLNDNGYPMKPEWFAPHFEFRFPQYGEITRRGVNLEIRGALEPWHVLGEQGAAGGTVRNVDSSLERLQIKTRGMTDSRHVVCVNGRRAPLQPTDVEGEYVAGVRFRAWQPPECLHPHIPVHAPLTFDIVDTWNDRAIGACTYHVSHPGGRGHETLPINAYEAEGRRLSRFFSHGHSQRKMDAPPEEPNRDYPCTLDLRHQAPLRDITK